ncbi:MAG: glycosyltransferase [bacterium]
MSKLPLKIVYVSNVFWPETKFSKQELTLELSKDHQVTYINPSWHILSALKNMKRWKYLLSRKIQVNENLKIINVFGFFPWHRFKATAKIHEILIERAIRKNSDASLDVIIFTNPADYKIPLKFKYPTNFWHWTDDYAAMPERNGKHISWQQVAMAKNVDAVLACSNALAEKASLYNPKTFLFRNACNPESFSKVNKNIIYDLKQLPKPIIGFQGTVNERIDKEMLEKVIADNKHFSFVFVGNTETKLQQQLNYSNVFFYPAQPKESLGSIIDSFDVGFLPYKDNLFNRSSNPLKIYEYLLLGKPVVSFNLDLKNEFEGHLYQAEIVADFAKTVRLAITDNHGRKEQRMRFAYENTWLKRANQFENIIEKLRLDEEINYFRETTIKKEVKEKVQ